MQHTIAPIRRHLRALAALAVAGAGLLALAAPAAQAAYPEQPVKLVVGFPPGGGGDLYGRLIANAMGKTLGQTVVVDNRAGAGGNIGTAAVARSPADGYTLLLGTNATNAANEFLYPSLGFDAAADFDAVAMIGLLPMVVSTSLPDLPANGIAELVARARARPDTLHVGLPSTTASVVFAQFVKQAKAPLSGVKYKSSAQSMTDAMGGHIPLVIDTVTATRPRLADGRMRALGITSLKASEMLPGVKPVSEQGVPGFDVVAWDALFAPRGTPPHVVSKLAEHLQHVLQQPDVQRKLLDIGVEPLFMGPSQLDRFVKDERAKWGAIIKAADIRVD